MRINIVEILKSSANYMGYEKLVKLYRQLEKAIFQLSDANQEIFNELGFDFYQTHILPVIQQVVQCFPSVPQLHRFAGNRSSVSAGGDEPESIRPDKSIGLF